MEDLIHMDNNEKFTFWVVIIGVLILIGCFTYIIVRNIKQKKKREAFSQNYNIDLPKNCLLDARRDAGTINTLVLAYPYVDGQRTNYSGLNNGLSTGSYGASYGIGGPQYSYNSGRGYSGFSTGNATTQDTVCYPYSELTIDNYIVRFKNPFDAYKVTLQLRALGHKIMPCMEEKIKESQQAPDTINGNDATGGSSASARGSSLVVLTPDDIMARIEPRFVSTMSSYYRDLVEYETSRDLL